MRSSRLPAVKTLAQFDFAFQPSITREQIESLHELGFLDRGENVILLGPPGGGKTHLAISLAIAAAEAGRRVYYGTLAGLIDSLMEARTAGELSRRLRVLTHPALLVVDGPQLVIVARASQAWVQQSAGICPKSSRDGFARDCPLRHPVLLVLALRDRSGLTAVFSCICNDFRWRRRGAKETRGIRGEVTAGVHGSSREPGFVVRVGRSRGTRPRKGGTVDLAAAQSSASQLSLKIPVYPGSFFLFAGTGG